jgi:hypothetical protein
MSLLGQHHTTIDILLRKARSLMKENLSKMKRLCEVKQFSEIGPGHHLKGTLDNHC